MIAGERRYGLIRTKSAQLIVLFLTGYVCTTDLRAAFSRSRPTFRWDIVDYLHPWLSIWVVAAINIVFYAFFLISAVALYRLARGKERILMIAWSAVFLSPLKLVSIPVGIAVRHIQALALL